MKNIFNYKSYLAILFIVFLGVFITNFPFGGYLSGWDNLHPEFNFGLNFSRGIESVWQANQGVGTYGGHGYAATLPHTIFLFLMSIVIPDMYLRSGFTFLTLIAGSTGVFYLMRLILNRENENVKNIAALCAGLFYMLNFATVQNFYIQLEAFIIHFALLPWLFYTLIKFFEKSTIKRAAIFFLVSLAASAQGFIPPLFIVYMILLSIFISVYFIREKSFSAIKKAALIFGLTILANLYWLLPVVLYSISRSDMYLFAYNNLSSTENFILKNQIYGNIKDMSILKGFISEAIDTRGGNVFYIFNPWLQHLDMLFIKIIGYLLFGVVLFGLFTAGIKKKISFRWFILIGFMVSFALLATDTFPFNYFTQIMQQIPVLKQAFRVAFTKFSIAVSFFYALAFGLGVFGILSYINRINLSNVRQYLIGFTTTLILGGLITFSLPVFKGNFLYETTRIDIPNSYFEMFEFFNESDDNGRIANLPQGWNWGWSVYDWPASPESNLGGGYSGSGFLWYGIKQPIMDRAFDVWGKGNESYYWEISKAIYSEKFELLDKIFDKYNVKWVIMDRNIIPYTNARGFLFRDQVEKYLDESPNYKLVKTIKSDKKDVKDIKIYEVKSYALKSFNLLNEVQSVAPEYKYTQLDQAFNDLGDYYSDDNSNVYYPFRDIFSNNSATQQTFSEKNITIEESEASITIIATLPEGYIDSTINTKEITDEDQYSLLSITKEDDKVAVRISKNMGNSYDSRLDTFFTKHEPNNCKEKSDPSQIFLQETTNDDVLRFTSKKSDNCYTIILESLPQRLGYLIKTESRHIKGKRLQFALVNEDTKKVEIEYPLTSSSDFESTYQFVPSMKYYGVGYSLSFNNSSISKETINELKQVNVYPIPYELIASIKLTKDSADSTTIITNDTAFDSGWNAYIVSSDNWISKAFPFFRGTKIENHIKVNNWANGWEITEQNNDQLKGANSKVVFVFMPQYLEYLGLILAGIPIAVFLMLSIKKVRLAGLRNRFKNINSFFEIKSDIFKNKIIAEKNKNMPAVTSFPYSIDLSDRKKYWQNLN